MKKFIFNIVLIFILGVIVGELVVRITYQTSDIPQREIDEFGIQKYIPKKEGYWKGGDHKWYINDLGWPGCLPDSYSNLVTIIGDSFIENFMNPQECHQCSYLKNKLPKYNYLEIGRSGMSLIEEMEVLKQLDSLKPLYSLVYVNNSDFVESIKEIKEHKDITQVDLKKGAVIIGELKSPIIKQVLYNWKLLYYFYNRMGSSAPKSKKIKKVSNDFLYDVEVEKLMEYIKKNYNVNNIIFVFHPNTENKIIEIVKKQGLKVVQLNSKGDSDWSFEYDSHWTCYGHKRVSEQVSEYLSLL